MKCDDILIALKGLGERRNVEGMARFGIRSAVVYGVPKPALRKLAREIGSDHNLALEIWASSVHEARVLASMIDNPARVTAAQMGAWAGDFDNWDICDQCCLNLFWKTAIAYDSAEDWTADDREFVKRAGFVMMASLAVHDKKASDMKFERFLGSIRREAGDERNFVRKAVSWALRQIGKRNASLRQKAIEVALDLRGAQSRSARWIGTDAVRELSGKAGRLRVGSRG